MDALKIIDECVKYILSNKLSANIEAVIMVGSFSRGEEIICNYNGNTKILSDLEFMLVSKPVSFDKMKAICQAQEKEIEGYLKKLGYDLKVSLGFTTRQHLKRFKPYIFTIETKKFGKVLWGDEKILDLIPNYSFEDIEPIDGFILLNNRIVEQLIIFERIKRGEGVHQYEINKGYIQIANSLLAFHRQYKSLYPEKKEVFSKLFPSIDYLNKKVPGLASKVENALDSLKNAAFEAISHEEFMRRWQELRDYFKEVWIYEACKLANNIDTDLDHAINNFLRIPDFKSRLKGWVKMLSRGALKMNILRLNFSSSPQFLIYQKAVKAYFSDNAESNQIDKIIKDWESFVK